MHFHFDADINSTLHPFDGTIRVISSEPQAADASVILPQRGGQTHQRAAFRRGTDGETAANVFHPFAHVAQAISARLLIQPRRPAPVVLNLQAEGGRLQLEPGLP